MTKIPDAAVQAAITAGGMEGWDHIDERMKEALTAALPYLQPVDVAVVRRQALEEAANIAKDWWHNPKQERPDMAIRALSAEPAQGEP